MDPVTHVLAGGLVGKTGLCRRLLPPELERRGVLWTAAFALSPDLDAVAELSSDPLAYLRYHRGATHSLVGGAVLALALALVFGRLFPGVPRRRVLALTATGVYLHILLDVLTSYGTMLLYPFGSTRYTLDWLYIVDPTFSGILMVGFLAAYLLRRAPRRVAKWALGMAAGYVLVCGLLQWHARLAVANGAAAHSIQGIRQVAALPAPFVPLYWTGIVETEDAYYRARLELLSGARADIRFVKVPKVTPDADRDALEAVRRPPLHEQVQLYEWFARFPVVTVEPEPGGPVVRFYDLRFDLPGIRPDHRPFVFTVRLNAAGEVVETRVE